MSGEMPERGGVNESEAGLLWAIAAHGGTPGLLDGAEPGPAADLRSTVEAVDALAEEGREELAGRWKSEAEPADRQGGAALEMGGRRIVVDEPEGRWAPPLPELVDPRDAPLDRLAAMESERLGWTVRAIGLFEFAELMRGENRRRVARVVRKLPAELGDLLIEALRRERETDRQEEIRIREVFVGISRRFDDLPSRVEQLGLYSVGCAAGYRFRDRISRLLERLNEERAEHLKRYYRSSYASTRRGVARDFRASIGACLDWLEEGSDG